jgi:dTDP-4-amino-4,6-dideoxygalactose transaminase
MNARADLGVTAAAPPSPLPKGPVLGWRSLAGAHAAPLPWVGSLPHCVPLTSGRAALFHALQALALPAGGRVLVPTYHCPTMVAPVLCAGLQPQFIGVGVDGLPQTDALDAAALAGVGAIIVPHYFGLVRDLGPVRRWCDAHGIALIEDCAHALFGAAAGTSVGRWGDYATASVSKFLPVSEMGLLGSARHRLQPQVAAPGARAQLKGVVDVLEQSARFGRPAGLAPLLKALFALKNRGRAMAVPQDRDAAPAAPPPAPGALPADLSAELARMLRECDMARIGQRPVWAARAIHGLLPRGRLVARRQRNFDLYAALLASLPGTRALAPQRPPESAPYVFPLWVDDAERVYHALRTAGLPVFRWDRLWPGTPQDLPGDTGPAWSHHVVQLLCHQDLGRRDVERTAAAVRAVVTAPHR